MSTTKRDEAIEYLTRNLSDYEFEMLLRNRINRQRESAINTLHYYGIEISDYYKTVQFIHNNEGGKWVVTLGRNYDDSITEKGEVLSMTMADAVEANKRKHDNKLSLLLPAPELVMNNQDDPGDAAEPPAFDAPEGPAQYAVRSGAPF